MFFDKTIDFMKVLISKIIYDDKTFDKTIDFMKVMISKIIWIIRYFMIRYLIKPLISQKFLINNIICHIIYYLMIFCVKNNVKLCIVIYFFV
jgi:glucan phosphoethanolaminetransferase (alkaline phosphatase superfamily)